VLVLHPSFQSARRAESFQGLREAYHDGRGEANFVARTRVFRRMRAQARNSKLTLLLNHSFIEEGGNYVDAF
jgi:hypothetical protein